MGIAGLLAFFFSATAPTYSHDVAPLLYARCAACHREGGVAPFPLLSYATAAKRAKLIAAVTAKRYMPPWLPTAPRFQHETRLSDAEIALLARWAAAGAPEGNPRETPPPPKFSEGWALGKPDLEAVMPAPFEVPADGPDLYRCFVIPAPAARDAWVRAIDVRPGNTRSVHHVIVFQDTSRTARRRDTGSGYSCFGTPGFLPARGLGGWTPGAQPFHMPDDIPVLFHGGGDLVLQVHYHPIGKPETDRTRLALYFTAQPPARRLMDVALGSNRIDIPPGNAAYKVTDHFTLPVDVDAIGIIPHAHYVCKTMYVYAVLPDGSRRTLLRIPDWNFNWQGQYRYAAPIRLPEDARIEMEFTYDNSAANPRNPNQPPARIKWGPATTDEMAGVHLEVVPVHADDGEELSQALWGKMMRSLGGGIYRKR
ncbi:MAG: ascorbate-dependent monooxygenase [Candidatus Solibacter sp.]